MISINYDPLTLFLNNWKSNNIDLRIETIKNITTYAIAWGPVRAREEILSFISDFMEDDEKVIQILIEKMPDLIPYIGGKEYSSKLLESMGVLFQVDNPNFKDLIIDSALKIINVNPLINMSIIRDLIENMYESENDVSKMIAINLGEALIKNSNIEEDVYNLTMFFISALKNEFDIVRWEIYKCFYKNIKKIQVCLEEKKQFLLNHFKINYKIGTKYLSLILIIFFNEKESVEIIKKIITSKNFDIKINFLKGWKYYIKNFDNISEDIYENIINLIKENYNLEDMDDKFLFKNQLLKLLLIIPFKNKFEDYFNNLFNEDDHIYLIENFWSLLKIDSNKKEKYINIILEVLNKEFLLENIELFKRLYKFLEEFDFDIINDYKLFYNCLKFLLSFKQEPEIRKKLFPLLWKYKANYNIEEIKYFYFNILNDDSNQNRNIIIENFDYTIFLFNDSKFIQEIKEKVFNCKIKFKLTYIDLLYNIFLLTNDVEIKNYIFQIYLDLILSDNKTNNLIYKICLIFLKILNDKFIFLKSDFEEIIKKLLLINKNKDKLLYDILNEILWSIKKNIN